jgi:23S rRNA (guanosine2251-2'-O)-methyltransferase
MRKGKPYPHGGRSRNQPGGSHPAEAHKNQGGLWLYGLHAVKAALANPRRKIHRLVLTPRAAEELGPDALRKFHPELAEMEAISRLLPTGSVHQGAAVLCDPLPPLDLKDLLAQQDAPAEGRRIVVVLDQLTDPHNVGAVLRSCAAFDVAAVIVQDRHAPPESGVLAKAASGALDHVPIVTVVNIARALEELASLGFWSIALAGDGTMSLREAAPISDIALVLGAEGAGIRRLVRERCDSSARIPISNAMESLNVSNAAAIALYELRRA